MSFGQIQGHAVAHRVPTTTAAVGITVADLAASDGTPADAVLVSVETKDIRYRIDGTTVTASTGHVLAAGEERLFVGADLLRKLSMIDTAAGASTVRYTTLKLRG